MPGHSKKMQHIRLMFYSTFTALRSALFPAKFQITIFLLLTRLLLFTDNYLHEKKELDNA